MKKLLLSLGALSAVVAPVAAVVACGSTDSDSTLDQAKAAALKNTTLTQEQKDAINGAKTMDALTTVLTEQTNAAGNVVDTETVATDALSAFDNSIVGKTVGTAQLDVRKAGTTTGALGLASNADELKAELATLVLVGKADSTKGQGYNAKYTFLKRTVATPLLDALKADGTNGGSDTSYTQDLTEVASGQNNDVDEANFVLVAFKDGNQVDASKFADKIGTDDAQLSFLLSRFTDTNVEHATPIAFVTPKTSTAIAAKDTTLKA